MPAAPEPREKPSNTSTDFYDDSPPNALNDFDEPYSTQQIRPPPHASDDHFFVDETPPDD